MQVYRKIVKLLVSATEVIRWASRFPKGEFNTSEAKGVAAWLVIFDRSSTCQKDKFMRFKELRPNSMKLSFSQ